MRHPVYVNRARPGQTTVFYRTKLFMFTPIRRKPEPVVCPGNDAVALLTGIDHGKVTGLGLLSVAPLVRRLR